MSSYFALSVFPVTKVEKIRIAPVFLQRGQQGCGVSEKLFNSNEYLVLQFAQRYSYIGIISYLDSLFYIITVDKSKVNELKYYKIVKSLSIFI